MPTWFLLYRVKTVNGTTNDFDIVTGVRQGCILSPLFFSIVIDFVMRKTVTRANLDLKWGREQSGRHRFCRQFGSA